MVAPELEPSPRTFAAWLRAHTIAVLLVAVVALLAIIGVTLFAMNQSTTAAPVIASVTYSQTQAGTNSAADAVVITSPSKIAQLQKLLTTFNIDPGVTKTDGASNGCVGGLSSNVKLDYTDGQSAEFATYVCGNENPEFSVALSDLLASWAN